MILSSAILLASCLALNSASDKITAGDLAGEFPGLAAIASDTPLSVAPAPGIARVFRIPELKTMAQNFHVEPPQKEICIQRTVALADTARMQAAMQASLPG